MRAVEVPGQIDAKHHIQGHSAGWGAARAGAVDRMIPGEAETTTDALTAAMNAVCAEVNTSLRSLCGPVWRGKVWVTCGVKRAT